MRSRARRRSSARCDERNVDVPQDRRIEFRIGVNLGDIIVEENDIYGDGVNVAARIESIAKPGGVAVSGTVRDHIGNKLDLAFEDRGEQSLKNIDPPVRIFDVMLDLTDCTAECRSLSRIPGPQERRSCRLQCCRSPT